MEKNLKEISQIVKQTLVGKIVEVFYSKNKYNIGIKGKCVEDRANILIISTPKGEKKIIKKDCWFIVYVGEYKVLIDGKKLVGKIEKRIKR